MLPLLCINKVGNVCVTNTEKCLDFFILMHALNSYCPKFLGLVHTKYSVKCSSVLPDDGSHETRNM
jgi:hypothetical protein